MKPGFAEGARLTVLALSVLSLTACASLPAGVPSNPKDPWQSWNRSVWQVNNQIDRFTLKPIAQAYVRWIPVEFREVASNVFANLGDVWSGINHFLQGKPKTGIAQFARFTFNSTLGFAGALDIASAMGFQRQKEDFGQTLGWWGIGSGPYLVLPILGPSSVRDGMGLSVDVTADLTRLPQFDSVRQGLVGARLVQGRSELLAVEGSMRSISLDDYSFVRDAYLARRRNLVYDGDPPDEPEDLDSDQPQSSEQR